MSEKPSLKEQPSGANPAWLAVPLAVFALITVTAGLVVKGRVTHAKTGQPVKDAEVSYFPLYPNPAVRVLGASFQWRASSATTAADGTYRIVVLPGPGVLGFRAYSPKE